MVGRKQPIAKFFMILRTRHLPPFAKLAWWKLSTNVDRRWQWYEQLVCTTDTQQCTKAFGTVHCQMKCLEKSVNLSISLLYQWKEHYYCIMSNENFIITYPFQRKCSTLRALYACVLYLYQHLLQCIIVCASWSHVCHDDRIAWLLKAKQKIATKINPTWGNENSSTNTNTCNASWELANRCMGEHASKSTDFFLFILQVCSMRLGLG